MKCRFVVSQIAMLLWLGSVCPGMAEADAQLPEQEPAVRAVEQVLPAVVNINTERVVTSHRSGYDILYYDFFGNIYRSPRETRQKVQSLGSGFLVDPSGFIVTNEHVVERAADLKIQVTTLDGTTYDAKYVAGDQDSDLAFIKIEAPAPLPFIDLNKLSPNRLGQTVLVLGNPVGYSSSVSRGILSATNRTVAVEESEFTDLLQTDAAINPGNSGGPIIDIAGQLVGVSSVKMAFTPNGVPTQGIGFGIPAQRVQEKVKEFKIVAARGPSRAISVSERVLGLSLQDLTEDLAQVMGTGRNRGVLVSDVEPGGPAENAGIERGLVIFKVGRYQVQNVSEVESLFERAQAGSLVDLGVGVSRRRGELLEPRVFTLTAR